MKNKGILSFKLQYITRAFELKTHFMKIFKKRNNAYL